MRKDDEFIALLLLNQPALPDISISFTLQESKTPMVLPFPVVGTKVVVISIKLNVIYWRLYMYGALLPLQTARVQQRLAMRGTHLALASKTKNSVMATG